MKSILDFIGAIQRPLTRPPQADDLSPVVGGEVKEVVPTSLVQPTSALYQYPVCDLTSFRPHNVIPITGLRI
jgi:hypothetical protein